METELKEKKDAKHKIICRKCFAENDSDSKICWRCGAPLELPSKHDFNKFKD